MIPLSIILVCVIGYALIRAKHDSFLKGDKWKMWAFIEGIFIAAVVVSLVLLSFSMKWWYGVVLGPIFGFSFWLVFDCVVGYYFTGNILYLGTSDFDLKMRGTFKYNLPIFGWESGSLIFILFKCFWLFLLIGAYFSLLN